MKKIYHAEGVLERNFVGQITYTICLERPLDKLDIEFSFDKLHYAESDLTPELMAEFADVCNREYGLTGSAAEIRRSMLTELKTEIHTLAMLNGEFIGCVHKQLATRHMLYDGEYASEGCIPQPRFEGVLQVTILVFNVLMDGTHYALTVRGE